MNERKRPVALWLLVSCLLLLSLGGFIGGISFMTDPSGNSLQMALEPLQKLSLPIQDYFWPGVFLLLTFGVFPLAVCYSLLARPHLSWAIRLNVWHEEYWALTLTLLVSVILITWIVIEVILIGLSQILQPLLILMGLVILGLALLPAVKKYYASN